MSKLSFLSFEDKPLGREIEDGLRFVFKKQYGKDFRLPSLEEDENEGTDAIIRKVRCDFTANMAAKDHCTVARTEIDLGDGVKIQFGVRTGNSHMGGTLFETPVLVIGITGDQRFITKNLLDILDAVREKADDIFAAGEDIYWAFTDGESI